MRVRCHVFTYGTLLFPEVMDAVAGRTFVQMRATLAGFTRVCVRGAVYPAAREEAGGRIAGLLYLEVDAASLGRLDRFEGELYERRSVRVICDDGTSRAAEVYVVPPARYGRLETRPWDLEQFRREHLASYVARCRAGRVAAELEG
jgi:gamma-glutamylcyclotransferase (GGCT)/AIG2-like uncharacterized protein YtfP